MHAVNRVAITAIKKILVGGLLCIICFSVVLGLVRLEATDTNRIVPGGQ